MATFLGGTYGLIKREYEREDGTKIPYQKGIVIYQEGNFVRTETLDEDTYQRCFKKLKYGDNIEFVYKKEYGKYKISDIKVLTTA